MQPYGVYGVFERHPGSPAKEDQYLNCAVVGQHVRVYKIKWGLKLIPSSP